MNPHYREAMVRYLAFLALACLIASYYAGRGLFFVWLVTAVVVYLFGRTGGPPDPTCWSRKRRKRR